MTIKTIKQLQQKLEMLRLASTRSDTISIYEAQMNVLESIDSGKTLTADEGGTQKQEMFLDSNDAARKVLTRDHYFRLPREVRSNAADGIEMSVSEYLRRPLEIAAGDFSFTDDFSTFPKANVFAGLAATNNANKLKGVLAIRATTVLTLQVNANRFQQGIYILAYMPLGGIAQSSPFSDDFYNMHRYSKVQITQLHHVKLDVACDTEVQIKIPYTSCTSSFPLKFSDIDGTTGSPGCWFLYPYTPLVTAGGSTTCSYTVWVHYEDIELLGNTVSQSGWEAQAGVSSSKGKDIITSEMFNNRPLSTGLTLAADISSGLSVVPLLSSITTPLSWLLGAASKAAFYWGWSKPLLISNTQRVIREPAPYIGNCDGVDTSSPLSLSVENHVGNLPGFGGTDVDELSIDFLKSKMSYFATFNYTTSSSRQSRLFQFSVGPNNMAINGSDGANTIQSFTPVAYLAYIYSLWRGSVTLRLKFAKTEFHSGRLELRYIPYNNAGGAPTTAYADQQFVMREIWDLRESSEITINLPFMSVFPWRKTDTTGYIGLFEVWVVDKLTAPATVSSTIVCLIEGCGGADMAFAAPFADNQNNYAPTIPYSLQCGWEAQAGDEECATESVVIGGAALASRSYMHEEVSIGEVSLSLRQLIKRGGFINPDIGATAASNYMELFPAVWGCWKSTLAATDGEVCYDPYARFSCMYALSRGGIRIKLIPSVQATSAVVVSSNHSAVKTIPNVYKGFTKPTVDIFDQVGAQMGVHLGSLGAVCIQMPQYLQTVSRCVAGNFLSLGRTLTSTSEFTDPNYVSYGRDPDTLSSERYFAWRSGADDFNLGDFVSVPSMAVDQLH